MLGPEFKYTGTDTRNFFAIRMPYIGWSRLPDVSKSTYDLEHSFSMWLLLGTNSVKQKDLSCLAFGAICRSLHLSPSRAHGVCRSIIHTMHAVPGLCLKSIRHTPRCCHTMYTATDTQALLDLIHLTHRKMGTRALTYAHSLDPSYLMSRWLIHTCHDASNWNQLPHILRAMNHICVRTRTNINASQYTYEWAWVTAPCVAWHIHVCVTGHLHVCVTCHLHVCVSCLLHSDKPFWRHVHEQDLPSRARRGCVFKKVYRFHVCDMSSSGVSSSHGAWSKLSAMCEEGSLW